MTKISFSINSLTRALVITGIIIGVTKMMNADELTLFVHPRFTAIIKLAVYALFPLAIMQMLCIVQFHHIHNHYHAPSASCACHSHGQSSYAVLPFLIILAMGVYIPNGTLDSAMAANKGLNTALASVAATSHTAVDQPRPLAAKLRQAQSIQTTDLTYTEVMSEINDFPQEYLGKQISMTGFVFRVPGSTDAQFSLVRYVVVCCTADALPYGVLCDFDRASAFPNDTWVAVNGIITKETFDGKEVGAIKITAIKQIEKPSKPYVFPYSE